MIEWQPIETAKKNDKDILVAFRGKSGKRKWQIVAMWMGNDEDGGWVDAYGGDLLENVTHWKPLSEFPE